uniref:Mitogen-activated protein kinase kinase kinase 1 n=1 Tax=Hirondellea gigas TaxID=1518452 RepID=A0A6A7G4F2_9CRUS
MSSRELRARRRSTAMKSISSSSQRSTPENTVDLTGMSSSRSRRTKPRFAPSTQPAVALMASSSASSTKRKRSPKKTTQRKAAKVTKVKAQRVASASSSSSSSSAKPKRKAPTKKAKPVKAPKAPKVVKEKVEVEKRLMRYRSRTQKIRERISRALNQRLYLIRQESVNPLQRTYAVLGSTGNMYTIQIGKLVSCSCPDFGKGNVCKHCLFIFLKVLKVPKQSDVICQKALLSSELVEMFANAPSQNQGDELASKKVRKAYDKALGIESDQDEEDNEEDEKGVVQKPIEGDCAICFDDLGGAVVWCRAQCGQNVHHGCFQMWSRNKKASGEEITCVYCRVKWLEEPPKQSSGSAKTGVKMNEGYMNFSQQQGQQMTRDYYGGYNHWRRRYY